MNELFKTRVNALIAEIGLPYMRVKYTKTTSLPKISMAVVTFLEKRQVHIFEDSFDDEDSIEIFIYEYTVFSEEMTDRFKKVLFNTNHWEEQAKAAGMKFPSKASEIHLTNSQQL